MPILGIIDSSKTKKIAGRWSGLVDEPSSNMEFYFGVTSLTDGTYATGGGNNTSDYQWIIDKWNTDGTLAWQKSLSTTETTTYDYVYTLRSDNSNNIYAYGAVKSSSGSRAGLVKYNSSGTLQWQRQFGSASYDAYLNRSFTVKSTGETWICGFNNNGAEAFICTYDSSGSFTAIKSIQGNQPRAQAIYRDGSSNTYVGGFRYTSPYEGWIAKFDSSNNFSWAKTITIANNSSYFEIPDIVTDSSGNVYVLCFNTVSGTQTDAHLIKFNSSGTLQWERKISRGTYVRALALAIDSSDNLYATFYSGNTGWQYVLKYNSSGSLQWQRSMPYLGNIYGYQAETNSENLFIGSNQYLSNSNAVVSQTLLTGQGVGRSVTINGYTGTYAASDFTDSAGSLTYASWSPSIGTPNGSSSTSSFTEATTTYSSFTTSITV